jgi:hypothetical protein
MWKAAAAAVVSFTMGGAAMTVLGTLLGGYAEAAALGLAGIGSWRPARFSVITSSARGGHEVAPAPESKVSA